MSDADQSGNWEQCVDVALDVTTLNGGKWSHQVIPLSDMEFSLSEEGEEELCGNAGVLIIHICRALRCVGSPLRARKGIHWEARDL